MAMSAIAQPRKQKGSMRPESPAAPIGTIGLVSPTARTQPMIATLARDVGHYLMNTYSRLPVALVRGEGTWVWDTEGKRYLDFIGGIAVNALGHCHPKVVEAITAQASQLMHCSNLFYIEPQVELARLLVEASGLGKVFFCNSGAEANEAAIKLARKYAKKKYSAGHSGGGTAASDTPPYEIITAAHSFHGRTLAALTATGQPKYQEGFGPLPAGFKYVPFGSVDALWGAVSPATCAVMLEPIQGEAGVNVPPKGYLESVRELCDEKGILLILDEVQTGLGRTGAMFAFQHAGIKPDIMTLAKGLGGGFPIGAVLASDEVASSGFAPGDHGSTFGGNPVACAAGVTVMKTLLSEGLAYHAKAMGKYLKCKLEYVNAAAEAKLGCAPFTEVRGLGLLVGAEVNLEFRPGGGQADGPSGPAIALACLENGLLVNCAAGKVLRFMPPLNVSKAEIDEAISILTDVLMGMNVAAGGANP